MSENMSANQLENKTIDNSVRARMKELTALLDQAARAYYQEDREIMSNMEYDALYDELLALEKETGIVMAGSPTHKVGYEILSELEKVAHDSPMLSLDKTKNPEDLVGWIGDQEGMLSWKMDGLTVVLTYHDGQLEQAVTRGNGTIGEVITNNAKVFKNLPARIPWDGEVVLRGEAIIHYSDFEKLNASIEDVDARYKNPRNLCSGSVRQLNNEITAKRNVYFYAFSLVSAEGREEENSVEANMLWLQDMGFTIVPYVKVKADNIVEEIQHFSDQIKENDFPSDGLVLIYDDIAYGRSLGRTAKFPRNAIAFKWADEEAETRLIEIEWSPSRTGLINPVAIFEPVELEGTTVSRASLHNISIIESLELGEGDQIKVYKANMIIPQVSENLTKSGNYPIADHCPACGGETVIRMENGVKSLYCANPFCSAKKIKLLTHFVGRDAMNIDGLSEATLTKMTDQGYIEELYDIYRLDRYEEGILEMEGFGEKSYRKLIDSIEASRKTQLFRFVYSLGILNVGSSNAKLLCNHFGNSLERIREASVEEMVEIDGIGEVIARSAVDYFANEHNQKVLEKLLEYIIFEQEEVIAEEEKSLNGKTFVITGSVNHFKNRKELKEKVESLGGKVTGSVSAKTDYLINNDNMSSSSKNKKAKELGIPIITEEEFLQMIE
ncbi:MAG: NAD-dependent DNA ligase LigA [Eubacteriales bacterium]|nr:NAD-dependent DNA ligase LigA [Eubacteriales bacterium]